MPPLTSCPLLGQSQSPQAVLHVDDQDPAGRVLMLIQVLDRVEHIAMIHAEHEFIERRFPEAASVSRTSCHSGRTAQEPVVFAMCAVRQLRPPQLSISVPSRSLSVATSPSLFHMFLVYG